MRTNQHLAIVTIEVEIVRLVKVRAELPASISSRLKNKETRADQSFDFSALVSITFSLRRVI